jgi:hypothetical protein
MAIRKTDDIVNETASRYTNQRNKREVIEERFDDTTYNDNPYDDALQYLSKKIDEIIDTTNNHDTIVFPVISNFSGDINSSAAYIPLSEGEIETTNIDNIRNNFVAPMDGELKSIAVRSNYSLLERGRGVTLTCKVYIGESRYNLTLAETQTLTTLGSKNTMYFSFSNSSFSKGARIAISLQLATVTGTKAYFVTSTFSPSPNV